jgi:uncharacterized protein YjdB
MQDIAHRTYRTALVALAALAVATCAPDPTSTHPANLKPGVVPAVTAPDSLRDYTLKVGEGVTLQANLQSPGNKPRAVQWQSRNTAVATVSNTGYVTAVAAGVTHVVADNDGKLNVTSPRADSSKITVIADVAVDSVEISPASASISVSGTASLTATLRSGGTTVTGIPVTWSSSNTSVVTVTPTGDSTATITGVATGSAFVQATAQGVSDAIPVTVNQAAVHTIAVTPANPSVAAGATQQFTATLKDASNNTLTGRAVAWSSSNELVATVNASGLATSKTAGTATITASSEGKDGSTTLTVTAPSCTLVGGTSAVSTSSLSKPAYLTPVTEPDFGTTLTRITGNVGSAIGNNVADTWPDTASHEYAKDQPWFADGRLLVLKHMQHAGGPQWSLFLDGDTYQPLFKRGGPPLGGEWRVHPTKADTAIYLTTSGPSAGHWNVRTNGYTTLFTTTGYSTVRMGWNEGNVSDDGRYVPVNATRNSDGKIVVFAIDLVNGTKSTDIDVAAAGVSDLDWVSVSPLGTYIVVHGVVSGVNQSDKIYNRSTGALVQTWTDWQVGHMDLGVDASGNEIAFGRPGTGTYQNRFVSRHLASGGIMQLNPGNGNYFSYHASVRNIDNDGYGEASIDILSGALYTGEVILMKLDASGTVRRLAHHRSVPGSSFFASPRGVPSPDARRVLFASNWGTTGPVSTYVVDTRQLCPSGLP